MRYYAVSGSAARQRTDCAIVGLYESGTLRQEPGWTS